MPKIYDNWERLVDAVLDREELRELALCESFSTASSVDVSSRFSVDQDDYFEGPRISTDLGAFSSTRSLTYHPAQYIEFDEIKKATRNFNHNLIIGDGEFGTVYKGWIDEQHLTGSKKGSGMAVAVKKSVQHSQEVPHEWRNQIHYMSQLHHPNLVRLIGFCDNEENRILVYEFMPNGSLDKHLFTRGNHQSLSWETRIKVAIGVARGLSFLHDREKPIIHRGFNTRDILLNGDFNAMLSDFGMARDYDDETLISPPPFLVPYGYVAPEYVNSGELTPKCDVYGFGVVFLELISGRRVLDRNRVQAEQNLVQWAKPYLRKKENLLRVMDVRLEGQYPRKVPYNVATLALQCLSKNSKQRPRMDEVLVSLEQL